MYHKNKFEKNLKGNRRKSAQSESILGIIHFLLHVQLIVQAVDFAKSLKPKKTDEKPNYRLFANKVEAYRKVKINKS